jgi:5-methylcytosine-specific restriction endonuclease McrA
MPMSKKNREILFNKYAGRCAYCGDPLVKGWHVDEILPVRRNFIWDQTKKRYIIDKNTPMQHPERLHIDNQNPACASCNINKHEMSLEEFRVFIANFMNHLNNISTQYKIAKRFGLIAETNKEIKFYFETL